MQKDCAVCGGRFTAKRAAAQYCSDRCRKRKQRAPEAAPPRREGAAIVVPVTELAAVFRPPADDGDGLLETTERELRDADRLNTSAGQAAMFLARVLKQGGVGQTGSSIASLIREHRATLAKALDGANAADDPLVTLRKQRQQRRPA